MLIRDKDAHITILGNYDRGDQPVIIAFDYGLSKVFLSGTHPEVEEDGERDGVIFADEFEDHGSDWESMRKAVLWVINR